MVKQQQLRCSASRRILMLVVHVPPKSDHDGNTVSDLAPESSQVEYDGSQNELQGVTGFIPMILSEFEKCKVRRDDV